MHHFKSAFTLAILMTTMSTHGMELQIQEKATEKSNQDPVTFLQMEPLLSESQQDLYKVLASSDTFEKAIKAINVTIEKDKQDLITLQQMELAPKPGIDIKKLPRNVYMALASSNTLEKAIEAINIASISREVLCDNLKDFIKLVHILAYKFDEYPITIAEKFNTSTAKRYIELHDKLGQAVFDSVIEYTDQLILKGADITDHASILQIEIHSKLKEKQFTPIINLFLKRGIDQIQNYQEYQAAIILAKEIVECERLRQSGWNYFKYGVVFFVVALWLTDFLSIENRYPSLFYLGMEIFFFMPYIVKGMQVKKLDTYIRKESTELEKAIQLSRLHQEDLITLQQEDTYFKEMDISECSNIGSNIPSEKDSLGCSSIGTNVPSEVDCTVCFDTKDISDCFVVSGCEHIFCIECILEWVKAHSYAEELNCPCNGCHQQLSTSDIIYAITIGEGKPEEFDRFAESRTRGNIENSKSAMKPCPRPGCDCIHIVTTDQIQKCTQCLICHHFCCSCGYADHPGITCQADAEIERDCLEPNCGLSHARVMTCEAAAKDKKNAAANQQIARKCPNPRCQKSISKNGGCNHMTCRKTEGGCGYEFCWHCLAKYGSTRCHASFCEKKERDTGNGHIPWSIL